MSHHLPTFRLVITTAALLVSSTALAQAIHHPRPTTFEPGDAPRSGYVSTSIVELSPAAGDVSMSVPAGSTIVKYPSGMSRRSEVVNPAGAQSASAEPARHASPNSVKDLAIDSSRFRTEGNARFISGGVGENDLARMKMIEKQFPLKLTFAANSGHFLSDVDVVVMDARGNQVLSTVTEGPVMLVDLPAGTYKVNATYDSATEVKNVTVGSKGTRSYEITYKEPVV